MGVDPILPAGGRLTATTDDNGEPSLAGYFERVALCDGSGEIRTYQLYIEEDAAAEEVAEKQRAAQRAAQHAATGAGNSGSCGKSASLRGAASRAHQLPIGPTSASAALTAELKSLSVEEIREGSDRYQALLAARDMEDVLYGAG